MVSVENPTFEQVDHEVESVTVNAEDTMREKLFALTITRFAHLFEQQKSEDTFANYLESVTRSEGADMGIVGFLAECAQQCGQDIDVAEYAQQINQAYAEGGADKVSEFMARRLDTVPKKEIPERLVTAHEEHLSEFPSLFDLGYKEDEMCLQLHISPLYHFPATSLRRAFAEGMKQVASMLRDEYPHVRVVVGKSWLLDTDLAKRLGFHIVEEYRDTGDVDAMDGQIIRSDGTIDEDLATVYKNGGTMPHPVRLGYMTREEVLKNWG